MTTSKTASAPTKRAPAASASAVLNPKAAVPILLFTFVFCLVIDNGFKFMTKPIGEALGLSPTTASLQATLAGIVIGIGAVVYAALADTISIRLLMTAGVAMVALGSVIGFLGQDVWALVLLGRIVQTCGLAAAETLYVIYVTKYLDAMDQKTYLGFSTSAFQMALLVGTLTSGLVATYVSWTAMFIIAFALIVTIPVLLKTVPKEQHSAGHVDVLGLFLIAVIATSVMFFMQAFNPLYLVPIVLGVAWFAYHVGHKPNAVVSGEFFRNGRYVCVLLIVLLVYSVQLGYSAILLPYMVDSLHGIKLDGAAYILAPGYICAVIVGALSGKIGRVLSSRQTILLGLGMITLALVLPAVFINASVAVLIVSMVIFPSGFALMYAPLVATAVGKIPAAKSGIAIGFYNLTINIAVPVGIAYSAKLLDVAPSALGHLSNAADQTQQVSSTILWILALIVIAGIGFYLATDRVLSRRESAEVIP